MVVNINDHSEEIQIKENTHYPGIEVKLGNNQYSRHSHVHEAWSLSYVLRGRTVVSLGNWKSVLKENQFIAIPPGVPHLCSPETEHLFTFAVLYVPEPFLNNSNKKFFQPRLGEGDSAVIFEIIERFIQAESASDLKKSTDKLQNFLKENSTDLEEEWGSSLLREKEQYKNKLLQGSRFQHYRYMRKLFGLGQKKLSTIEKMEKAKKLLSEGIELAELAIECGFYDQSHFCKVFKLYTGLTPTQYLNK